MARLALLLLLLAQPDAGPAKAPAMWIITFGTSTGVDPGDGHLIGTNDTRTVITPTEVRSASESTHRGQASRTQEKPTALPPATRDAIAALLPTLPPPGTYSISPYVNDEGWYSESLTVEREGKAAHYQLVQGRQAPPMPEALEKLHRLLANPLDGR